MFGSDFVLVLSFDLVLNLVQDQVYREQAINLLNKYKEERRDRKTLQADSVEENLWTESAFQAAK